MLTTSGHEPDFAEWLGPTEVYEELLGVEASCHPELARVSER